METVNFFTLSVFASIVASAVFMLLGFLTALVINKKLIPWYQNRIYQGIHLDGHWEGEQISDRGRFGFKFTIEQIGPHVSGTFQAMDEYADKKRNREHSLSGIIQHNHLILQYNNKKKDQLGMGAFLFSIRDGGNELYGSMMFLQTATGQVGASNELSLTRCHS